jgi:hypothetical protein
VTLEPPKSPVAEGEVVAGKYRIERTIGSGGMGVVMAARHLTLDEPVALKFVIDERGNDPEAKARMMREARATFRLRSEHTVRVLDVGELPSGPLYIVMELLEGRDLKRELAARGPLPEREVVRYALEACIALEEAHAIGIVHRDLKPHNMFLSRSSRGATVLKILDFGMSKLDPELFEASPLTRPATALGTPRYMAPEQWKSAAEVDARADVWALGVVMYELLTGEAPVANLRGAERQARLLAGAIPDPRELNAEVTEAVARVVMKCLRADPEVRWKTVRHLATALRDAHPELAKPPERAEVTRTDVTRAMPPGVMEKQAAAAFAPAPAPAPDTAAVPPSPATVRETPAALAGERTGAGDFDTRTEVRPPQFTPSTGVDDTMPEPIPAPPARAPRPNAATLRSAAAPPEVQAMIDAAVAPREQTLRMAAAPSPEAFAAAAVAAAAQAPVSAPQPSVPVAPIPPAPPRPVQPTPRRMIALAVVAGVVSLVALVALGWAVAQQLSR